ncbi:MAG: hypothetical protein AAFY41_05715 [Bacteroidota bacterium]
MIQRIHHQGKEIIYIDYRGLSDEAMHQTLFKMKDTVLEIDKHHLRLVNVTGVSASARFRTEMRKIGKEIGHIPSKVAIVGLSASKKVVINAYNQLIGGGMKLFDTENQAKEYLIA